MVGPLYKSRESATSDINEEELLNIEDISDNDEEEHNWGEWTADAEDEKINALELICLFCDSKYDSSNSLFEHCRSIHSFDFKSIRRAMNLDFYGCFKLINYVRSQVAHNRCWNLQNHFNEPLGFGSGNLPWDNDMYLKPFMEDDNLLYSFDEDDEADDMNVDSFEKMSIDDESDLEKYATNFELLKSCKENSVNEVASVNENGHSSDVKKSKSFSVNGADHEIMIVNKDYFGSYSSFGIHKEMISDKGYLAQAGALEVNAVEASAKMASVASQIAKDNGLLWNQASNHGKGVVKVINSMVEDLIKSGQIEPKSVDVLVSEWMGYCLLYESMLSSVLVARDHWLKPGGAMLPDTATMFVAGFGKGATSIPFWEDVYGFNMSSVGKERVGDAAHIPIVDVVDGNNLVTNTALLQTFDLVVDLDPIK